MVAHLRRHVPDEFLEHRLLAVELCVEGPEGDAGTAGNSHDRTFGEAFLAELFQRGVQDFPKRAMATRGAGGLALAGVPYDTRIRSRIVGQSIPLEPEYLSKLKAGSGFSMTQA